MQQEFLLTRSNYYNQNFNTAIFFDPFRIYFNNAFESAALDLYYHIQKHFDGKPQTQGCFYLLVYPEVSMFENSFGATSEKTIMAREGDDYIIGIKNIAELDGHYQDVIKALEEAVRSKLSNA